MSGKIGWRYTRAGRSGRRNGFISFISGVSMLGHRLGVAALIIVLSVMNGFQKEVRDRMLSVIAHVEVRDASGGALPDWRQTADAARQNPRVIGAAPFVVAQALVGRGDDLRGAIVRGIDPALEGQVTELARTQGPLLAQLKPGEWNIVLGIELARLVGARVGDKVTIVAPGGQVTPAGVVPRLKQFNLVGVFEAGHYEYDSGLATDPRGRRRAPVSRRRPHRRSTAAERCARSPPRRPGAAACKLGANVFVRDWTRTNANWFDAVQIEKRLMFIILTLIVAVAAFNLVSTLVMTVTDKRADIAILRTLGASPRSVMGIFMVQGAAAGVMGTLGGCALGLLVAFNMWTSSCRPSKRLLGMAFLPSSIYVISRMPSQPLASDIVPVLVISLGAGFCGHHLPQLARQPRQPGRGLAL